MSGLKLNHVTEKVHGIRVILDKHNKHSNFSNEGTKHFESPFHKLTFAWGKVTRPFGNRSYYVSGENTMSINLGRTVENLIRVRSQHRDWHYWPLFPNQVMGSGYQL